MLPGPPKECNAMFRACVMPYLRSLSDEQIVSHAIHVFGMSESAMDQIFHDEMNAMTNPTMAPYAKEGDCLLQVTAKAESVEKAEEMMKPVIEHVKDVLGDIIFGIDVDTVEDSVMRLLREKKMTFAAAESCTGGELAKRFTDIPGASEFFLGGVTTYTNEAKAKLLGIDPKLIEEKTAVSYEVAKQMAERVRALLGSRYGHRRYGACGPRRRRSPRGRNGVRFACDQRRDLCARAARRRSQNAQLCPPRFGKLHFRYDAPLPPGT